MGAATFGIIFAGGGTVGVVGSSLRLINFGGGGVFSGVFGSGVFIGGVFGGVFIVSVFIVLV